MTGHFKGNSDKQWGQNRFKVVFEFLFYFDFISFKIKDGKFK